MPSQKPPARKVRGFFFDIKDNPGYIDNVARKYRRRTLLPGVACLMLGLAPCDLPADIYKQVMPDGTVSYSDKAQPNAEKIEPPPPQVIPSVKPIGNEPQDRGMPPNATSYVSLNIIEPADNQVIWNNERNMSVGISIEPGLKVAQGHRLVLFLDSARVIELADGTRFILNNVDRGSHTLTAEVHDALGRVLIQSAPVTFHLKQHSTLIPRRPAAP